MRPARRGPAQGAVDQELTRGREQQVGAAYHLGDTHRLVVGDHGQFVRREAIAPPDQEVAEVAPRDERLRAAQGIGERDRLAVGHAKAPVLGAGLAGLATLAEGWTEGGREDRFGVILRMRGGQRPGDVLAGLVARINRTGGLQLAPDLREPGLTLRLHVRPAGAAHVGAFLPVEPEPAKVRHRGLRELRPATGGVEVLRPVNQGPAITPRAFGGQGERPRMADVQEAGGGRG